MTYILRKDLSGRNGKTIAQAEYVFIPGAEQEVFRVILGPPGDFRVVGGSIRKFVTNPDRTLETFLLREYAQRGFSVPHIRSEDEGGFVMDYVPGTTFFEKIFFDSTLDVPHYIALLREKYAVASAMDGVLPEILPEEQKARLLLKEEEKLKALGATPFAINSTSYTAKVKGRYAQLDGIDVPSALFDFLGTFEQRFAPLLQSEKRWFIEANGRNWVEDVRLDLGGVFEGHPDSFLLDTPYLFSNTYWLRRKAEGDFFLPRYNAVEKAKNDIVMENAVNEGRDPTRALFAYQISRVYRNLLELAYCYNDAYKTKEKMADDPVPQGARLLMYASMIFAHQEMQNSGVTTTLNTLTQQQPEAVSDLVQQYQSYDSAVDHVVKQMMGKLGLMEPAVLAQVFTDFAFIRGNYKMYGPDSPFSIFSLHESYADICWVDS